MVAQVMAAPVGADEIARIARVRVEGEAAARRARSGRRWWCAKMVVTAVLSLAAAWRPLPLLKRWR